MLSTMCGEPSLICAVEAAHCVSQISIFIFSLLVTSFGLFQVATWFFENASMFLLPLKSQIREALQNDGHPNKMKCHNLTYPNNIP